MRFVGSEITAKPQLLLQDQLVPQAHSSAKVTKSMSLTSFEQLYCKSNQTLIWLTECNLYCTYSLH